MDEKTRKYPGKPKNYQVPKGNHPWRQYRNKMVEELDEEVEEEEDVPNLITVKEFLEQLLGNWDKVEVTVVKGAADRSYPLKTLSQRRIAAYVCGVLRRNYVK